MLTGKSLIHKQIIETKIRKMKALKYAFALIATLLLTGVVTASTGVHPAIVAPTLTGLSMLTPAGTGLAFAGLNKEIWLDEIKEDFYANDMWISELTDMSSWVENDIINLAEAGVQPETLINNTTYPIEIVERTDGAIAISIDRFDTKNTPVKDADRVEQAYDKLKSVVYGHKQSLRMTFMEKGAHAIAPSSNSTNTPLIDATGGDNGNGVKRLTYKDVLAARKAFNNAEVPEEGRILILSAQHDEDLQVEDIERYNRVMDKGMLAGFKIYNQADKRLPKYDNANGNKVAFGAVVPATANTASIFLQKAEVMKAVGTDSMYHAKAEDDPTHRRDVVGFARRGVILPIRGKGIGALKSPTV